MSTRKIVVVGGGAAGFFAAIACAETVSRNHEVVLLEATAHPLAKVKVSGGGRCNVTHACFEPRELINRYPRGARELLGPFYQWQPRDTIAWFEKRGVMLKVEPDGRIFPTTDSSQTVIDCLQAAAQKAGVVVRTRCGLVSAENGNPESEFQLRLTTGDSLACDALLLATGGNRSSAGFSVAEAFGHTIEPLVPSLFTFQIQDPRLDGLAGIAVTTSAASVAGTKLKEQGPTLITHWGLSGPAILRLSAWGARELQARDYQFTLVLNWTGGRTVDQVRQELVALRASHPRRQIGTTSALALPQRLWERLVGAAGLKLDAIWTSISNTSLAALAQQLAASEFAVKGKSMNKEEFVTCGGVRLDEVEFKTMQSRKRPGLFFAGEVLDIDGITGGFNFQAAWTTGYLAGRAMAGLAMSGPGEAGQT